MRHPLRAAVLAALCLTASVAHAQVHAATPTENCFSYIKAQDYPRAILAGRDATRLNPQQGDAHFCLGLAHKQSGDLDPALRSLQQAERLYTGKSDLADVYAQLGHIAGAKGDLQQALNYYSRQLGLVRDTNNRSGESAALNNLANVFRDRGDLDKALDYFEQSLRAEPKEAAKAAKYNNIALIYSDKDDYTKALEYLDRAITLHQRNGDYHGVARTLLNKGSVQTQQGSYDAAAKTLNEGLIAIRKVGDKGWEASAQEYLGDLAESRGDLQAAAGHFREALRLARAGGAEQKAMRIGRKLAGTQKTLATTSYGVIEIGSKGVKGAVISASRDDKGRPSYESGFRKSINTNVIAGVAESGEFSTQAIDETAQVVKDLAQAMLSSTTNISGHLYVFGSSALAGAINRNDLAAKVKAASGLNLRFINSAEEMIFAVNGSVPGNLIYQSVLLDIGSGNGRLGYLIRPRGGQPEGQALIDLRAGSVTLADLANAGRKPGEDFPSALERVVSTDIAPRFAKEIKQYPVLSKHKYWVLVGGAAWAAATLMHPEDQRSYVSLSANDLRSYYDRLTADPAAVMNPDLSRIADGKVREAAAKQVESVKKVFTVENLQAGARLLKLVADNADFGKGEIWFARDGGWSNGLASALAAVEQGAK